MRKSLAVFVASAALVAFTAPAFAKTATVKGKVVDEGCSMEAKGAHDSHDAVSHGDHKMPMADDHKMADGKGHAMAENMDECAIMCAKNGEPLALLTADGKVYRITGGLAANKNAKLIEHVGKNVQITGDVFEKDGKVQIAADSLTPAK
jgi:hypothetical protein